MRPTQPMHGVPDRHTPQGLAVGLILLGAVARLIPHPPNVTPLTAIALVGGFYLRARWAIVLPLASVVLSDLAIGWHRTIPFTWGSFLLIGLLGWWVRRRPGLRRLTCAAGLGALLFFFTTNLGVWLVGDGTVYPKTAQGLWMCYAAGLPFLRNALVGDLVYTWGLFGLHTWASRVRLRAAFAHSGAGIEAQPRLPQIHDSYRR